MVRISKGMVAVAALVAFGFVIVEDMTKSLAKSATPFTQNQDATPDHVVVFHGALRNRAAKVLHTLTEEQKANDVASEPAASPKCREQTWPYYSGRCLVRQDGADSSPVRIVRIDRLAGGTLQAASLR
jgi:hypothetical protein